MALPEKSCALLMMFDAEWVGYSQLSPGLTPVTFQNNPNLKLYSCRLTIFAVVGVAPPRPEFPPVCTCTALSTDKACDPSIIFRASSLHLFSCVALHSLIGTILVHKK